jgi:hypothetical protein
MQKTAVVIDPKIADLGPFSVRRSLPSAFRRSVGPFVFYSLWNKVWNKKTFLK